MRSQRSTSRLSRKQRLFNIGWVALFLLPSAIPLLLFRVVPMIASAWISLHEWNMIGAMQWVGLDNYIS